MKHFTRKISKANSKGSAMVRLPKDVNGINTGDCIKVNLFLENEKISFYSKIRMEDTYKVFHVPKNLVLEHSLLGKDTKFSMNKSRGFVVKVLSDGRIYLPLNIAKIWRLKRDDIIKVNYDNKIDIFKINFRKRGYSEEFFFFLHDKKYRNNQIILQIVKKLRKIKNTKDNKNFINILDLFKDAILAEYDKNHAVVFSGNARKIILSKKIKIKDVALYIGAYLADGTKIGEHWRISASTIQQAKFYIKTHTKLIKNSKLVFRVSYSSKKEKSNIIKKYWEENLKININSIHHNKIDKVSKKHNPFGTLDINENSLSVLKFYNSLLKEVVKRIIIIKSKQLAMDFICGVLEGDGSVSGSPIHAHVIIHSSKDKKQIIPKILDIIEIKYRITKERGNAFSIRIGALELVRNLHFIKNNIFALYPKRKRIFIERLNSVGCIKFLLGKQNYASSWVKAWLKNEGIINKKYQLTSKGRKVKNDLLDMMKGVEIE
jgi:bifunctional DNA-binding transcriptional regulator/antitoxin component of YhaV-PrlF toxin-antitoxin module